MRIRKIKLLTTIVIFSVLFIIIDIQRIITDNSHMGQSYLKFARTYNSIELNDYHTELVIREINFDEDLLALMHIQKTSGSYWEEAINRKLLIKKNNKWQKLCNFTQKGQKTCLINKNVKSIFWNRYLSRYCDMHADYTELKNCIMYENNNRIKIPNLFYKEFTGVIHFITLLRDPINRYISEYRHVKRGCHLGKSSKSVQ